MSDLLLSLVYTVLYVLVLAVPARNLLRRAGYPPWMAVFAVIPAVNIAALWVFAFARWPHRRRVY